MKAKATAVLACCWSIAVLSFSRLETWITTWYVPATSNLKPFCGR
jgi:hypothetical protein